jgi:hypothetical protein
MLNPPGVGLVDKPPQIFRYGLASHDRMVRTIVPYIEAGFSDEEAWAALFDDEKRLSTFRLVHGNRPVPIPRAERTMPEPAPTRFDAA